MQALDAALAFGITMLILAMVVTTIVETMHRLVGLREKGLALLLENFYDRILASRTAGALHDEDDRRAFVEMMTVNRGPVGRAAFGGLHLNRLWSGRRLGSLGLIGFMERLGGSEYGATLMAQAATVGEQGVEWVLKDVAQKFDAFGREASEYFEARARLLSVLTGFVLAFAINVDALVMFETFMRRPDVTQAVIAKGEEVTKQYQASLEELKKRATTATAEGAPATTESQKAAVEGVRAAADRADAALKDLQTLGVPIGWTAASWKTMTDLERPKIFGILLGGLLIGLGAPFWYSAVQALTGVRRMARGDKEAPQPATPSAPATGSGDVPATPIDAFHAALGARLAAGELRPFEEAVG
jgi:hypothetical protein